MNKGNFGFGRPPFAAGRVTPIWQNHRIFDVAGTYGNVIVPDDVYQIGVAVAGGGGGNSVTVGGGAGGGGGGFSYATFDVLPGQQLPTLTVGGPAGTSSYGTFLTVPGELRQLQRPAELAVQGLH